MTDGAKLAVSQCNKSLTVPSGCLAALDSMTSIVVVEVEPMATRTTTTQEAAVQEATAGRCVHHWIVEPPGGPTSGARCRRCGEERSFSNNPEAVTLIETRGKSTHAWSADHRMARHDNGAEHSDSV